MDEAPLVVIPSLATAIGLEEAIIVQQIHFWTRNSKVGKVIDGERWVFNTYDQWQEHFPWWSVATIRRVLNFLEKGGLVISCQPDGKMSRKKYYRLNRAMAKKMMDGSFPIADRRKDLPKLSRSSVQNEQMRMCSKRADPKQRVRTEGTVQRENSEKTSSAEDVKGFDFPAIWKPNQGTKEQKLARIKPGSNYPSEAEFDQFLEEHPDGGMIAEYRPDLYHQLCLTKWHQWKDGPKKWVIIRNWKSYVIALAEMIENRE